MRRAFTLIELLVVIAIIAILAAILFPVFAQAKVAAKKTANISNHKQVALAHIQYSIDYDDGFALTYADTLNSQSDAFFTGMNSWQNLVQPYAKNWGIMIDPISQFKNTNPITSEDPFINYGVLPRAADEGYPTWGDTFWTGNEVLLDGLFGLGQAAHTAFWLSPNIGVTSASLSSSNVASPAGMVLVSDATQPNMWVMESADNTADSLDVFDFCWHWYNGYGDQTSGPLARYGRTDNLPCLLTSPQQQGNQIVEFTDGHAKSTTNGELYRTAKNAAGKLVYIHMWPTEQL
jgi:prepilin-type N-terminal cleavage/methylation domain-containing protein